MGKYIVKRVLLLIPTILIVCVIVFAMMRMMPGTAVDAIVQRLQKNGNATATYESVEAELGFDKPAVQQFFIWLWNMLHGDLGDSFFQNDTVLHLIMQKLPVSLELGIITLILTEVIAIPLGLLCAARQGSVIDVIIRVIAVIFMSMPVFWIAAILQFYPAKFFGFSYPTVYVSLLKDPLGNLSMFIMPAIIGAVTSAGMQLRTVRTVTLDVMRQDYIRTAWAKGVPEHRILFRHAFRNSLIPVITVIGGSVANLIGGSVILENVFNLPGIGSTVVTALGQRDYYLVQGCILVFSIFVMLINLIVDIAYKWIDPRVRLD